MNAELHIQLHPEANAAAEVANGLPLEEGQQVTALSQELITVDLGALDDTTTSQEWYLNGHDDVDSFFILADDPPAEAVA